MRINNILSGQTIEQFCQARLVRITPGRLAIWFDPFRVLNPKVVVNLFPELRVSVDLMMERRWLGGRFGYGAGWLVYFALSVSAPGYETNEFHKRLSIRG